MHAHIIDVLGNCEFAIESASIVLFFIYEYLIIFGASSSASACNMYLYMSVCIEHENEER